MKLFKIGRSLLVLYALVLIAAYCAAQYIYLPEKAPFAVVDAFENMLYGYYVANGWIAYRDFVSNHLPGVYFYLAAFFRAFSLHATPPSLELFSALQSTSYFATSFAQATLLYLGLRLLQFSRLIAVIAIFVVLYVLDSTFQYYYPFSETILTALYVIWPILVFKMYCNTVMRVRSAFILAGPFLALSIWLGLTLAPTTLLSAASAVLILLSERKKLLFEFKEFPFFYVVGSFITIIVVGSIFRFSDISGLYFYNVTFNISQSPDRAAIFSNLLSHYKFDWLGREPLLLTLPATSILLSLCFFLRFFSLKQNKSNIKQNYLFLFLVQVGAALCLWRAPFGSKILPLMGLNIGLIFLVMAILVERWALLGWCARPAKSFKKYAEFALGLGLLIYLNQETQFFWKNMFIHGNVSSLHQTLFRDAQICRFKESSSSCRCFRMGIFEPHFLLMHDVRQCHPDGIWIPLAANHRVTLERLQKDVLDHKVAFMLGRLETQRILRFPSEIDATLRRRKCVKIEGDQVLCHT